MNDTTVTTSEEVARQISVSKSGQAFVYRYAPGDEAAVLAELAENAGRKDLDFDWFDAAVLSHQLGRHLAKELRTYLPKKAA